MIVFFSLSLEEKVGFMSMYGPSMGSGDAKGVKTYLSFTVCVLIGGREIVVNNVGEH